MCLQEPFESGESASGVLSSPSNQLLGTWAEVAELLLLAEQFNEDVRLERLALLELLKQDLFVDDGLACGLGHDGGYFLPAVCCCGGAERLAFVLVALHEDGANELARVPDSADKGPLGLRGGVAGQNPGAIGSLS